MYFLLYNFIYNKNKVLVIFLILNKNNWPTYSSVQYVKLSNSVEAVFFNLMEPQGKLKRKVKIGGVKKAIPAARSSDQLEKSGTIK